MSTSTSSTLVTFGFLALMFVAFYFLLIRPQRKRQQDQAQMASTLQVGDQVITWAGIYGAIVSLDEDTVVLRVESGATIRMSRMAVAQKQPESMPK